MSSTLENLSRVSLFFLVLFGAPHLVSTFLLSQGIETRLIWVFFHSLDLPFLFSALVYGSSRLSFTISRATGNGKWIFLLSSGVSLVLLITAIYYNFFVPDGSLFFQ